LLKSTFFRRLFIPYLVLICLAVGGIGFFAAVRLRSTYLDGRRESLHYDLQLVSRLIHGNVDQGRFAELNQQVKELGEAAGARITIIRGDGVVLADSWAEAATMDNHSDRPEVQSALRQGEAFRTRHSATIRDDMLYLAGRFESPARETYYLRLAVRLSELTRQLRLLYTGLGGAVLLAMLAAGAIGYHFARRQTAPIVELTDVAEAMSRGDLRRRSMTGGKGEIAVLARAQNTMAQSMQQLLDQARKDKAELLTILAGMSDGVIATDAQQHIRVANEAAGLLLGFSADQAQDQPLWQVLRVERIIKAAAAVLETGSRTIVEAAPIDGRHVEVTLSPFGPDVRPAGLVLVAHDTTQSVRYQELRKEFVANVSHELRTPLSVIQGFVETLLDGAIRDPEKGPQYLETIRRHTGQLTNLVDDLLELSRLESQPDVPRRSGVDLAAATRKAAELLGPAAQKKSQTLTVDATTTPLVLGNADYLERAVTNLIDNAIKYTPEGGRIAAGVRLVDSNVVIEVTDNGIGIPEPDLPRIFERFYRVDRSRSREMGGTGLGLSIVKHVAQVHGGTVEVSSAVGKGSTFKLKIPVKKGGG
jgi:two-component system phosphate regulon sensor histidine kinase PhoR